MITKLEPWITKGLPEEEIERQHKTINELIEAVNKLNEDLAWHIKHHREL